MGNDPSRPGDEDQSQTGILSALGSVHSYAEEATKSIVPEFVAQCSTVSDILTHIPGDNPKEKYKPPPPSRDIQRSTDSFQSFMEFEPRFIKSKARPGITTELHSLIARQEWSRAKQRILRDQDEIFMVDEECMTVLALACDRDAPEDVVRLILLSNPDLPAEPDRDGSFPLHYSCGKGTRVSVMKVLIEFYPEALGCQNKFGNTPLQIAIERGVPSRVLRYMIEKNPGAASVPNRFGSYPLHYCGKDASNVDIAKLLLESFPPAIRKKNAYGATPLFLAVYWDAPVEILKIMLREFPAAARIRDDRGIYPIASAWNLYVHRMRTDGTTDEDEAARVAENRKALKNARSSDDLVGSLGKWWSKIELLLKAAAHDSTSSSMSWSVVHAASRGCCPPELLRFCIKLYKHQIAEKDEDGNLPIHIAASAPLYIKQAFETVNEPAIDKLLQVYPDGATVMDSDGRLPLHLALTTRKTLSSGVNSMLVVDRNTYRKRDPKTGLRPFMLAAVGNETESASSRNSYALQMAKSITRDQPWSELSKLDQEIEVNKVLERANLDKINTIFKLLLNAPDLLAPAIKLQNEDREKKNLREKTLSLRSHNIKLKRELKILRYQETRLMMDEMSRPSGAHHHSKKERRGFASRIRTATSSLQGSFQFDEIKFPHRFGKAVPESPKTSFHDGDSDLDYRDPQDVGRGDP